MKFFSKINFKDCCIVTFLIAILVVGLLATLTITSDKFYETFENKENQSCPDMLIQKGSKIYLYHSKKAEVPGVNPIEFQNLEEYVEFVEWQKSQNIFCPVLYLQKVYDTQGNSNYRIRPSPLDNKGNLPTKNKYVEETMLLDASHDDKPYNEKSHPGYDALGMYNGIHVPIDDIKNSNISAMNTDWDPTRGNQGRSQLRRSSVYPTYEMERVNALPNGIQRN